MLDDDLTSSGIESSRATSERESPHAPIERATRSICSGSDSVGFFMRTRKDASPRRRVAKALVRDLLPELGKLSASATRALMSEVASADLSRAGAPESAVES